jgi:hypothetical protein
VRAVVLVEGDSDQAALEALARLRGLSLDRAGVSLVSMGGATSIWHYLERFTRDQPGVRLAGLCDVAEEGYFRRGLERAGLGSDLTRDGMEALGFYVCDTDLEDELIRTLGITAVERIVVAHGDLRSLRALQKQPAQRGRSEQEQLRRFMGTRSGRKVQYARLLVEALDPAYVPRPLDRVLAHATAG